MLRNRDTARKNRANLAVQACVYSNIASTTIDALRDLCNNRDSKASELVEITKESTLKMIDCFLSSQDNMCNSVCMAYANEQYKQLVTGLKNGENIGDNDNVSEYLVTEEMVEMCKKKLACESQG